MQTTEVFLPWFSSLPRRAHRPFPSHFPGEWERPVELKTTAIEKVRNYWEANNDTNLIHLLPPLRSSPLFLPHFLYPSLPLLFLPCLHRPSSHWHLPESKGNFHEDHWCKGRINMAKKIKDILLKRGDCRVNEYRQWGQYYKNRGSLSILTFIVFN